MSQPEDLPPQEAAAPPSDLADLRSQLCPLLVGLPFLTLLTGAAFPLLLCVVARPLFPHQAEGSLLSRDGSVIGSELIGQNFFSPAYFHPRPSAAGDGYDGTASGGTNLGPVNPKLKKEVGELVEAYRRDNGLPPGAAVPIDAVTRSGSGLDPHISPANAELQVRRVARARGLAEDDVRCLVAEHTLGPQFGLLGEPRVNVLTLNLALDRAAPLLFSPSPPEG
jgi:K+-transporting ATPase ATPase C chain